MKRWVRPLGSLGIVALLAWRIDGRQVAGAFARLDASWWLLALAAYLAAQVASSLRWRMLARVHGLDGPLGRFLSYYFIGMFFNLALPTSVGGDVVRAWYLASGAPGRRLEAVLSVLADRVNGLVVLVFLAGVAYLFCPQGLPPWVGGCVAGSVAVTLLGLVVLLVLTRRAGINYPPLPGVPGRRAPLLPPLSPGTPGRGVGGEGLENLPLSPDPYPRSTRARGEIALSPSLQSTGARGEGTPRLPRLARLVAGAVVYRNHPGVLAGATLLSLVVQAANVVLYWLVGRALGLSVPLSYCGVLMPLVTLLTLLPISLNGMGLREAGTVVLLAPLGLSAETAVTWSLLTFAVYATASLGGAGFYLFGRFPRYQAGQEERGHAEPVRGDPDQGRARQPAPAA